MTIQTRKMTADEFLALPVSNLPHELIHGEEIISPSPTIIHQRISQLVFQLIERLKPDGEVLYAPVDVYLDDENIVQPDVLWIARGNTNILIEDKLLRGAPDLTVEIVDPGTARRDRKDRFRLYEKFGVREYWMIDPDHKLLEIWQLQDAHFMLVAVFGPTDTCTSLLLGEIEVKAIFPS